MSLLEHFDHPDKKQDKEHFRHLVQIALADGKIEEIELKMLHRLGKNMGFTEPEIEDLLESTKNSAYFPPYELAKRFNQLFGMVKIILADGVIDQNEMRLTTGLALKSGFVEGEIPIILDLLIKGIRNGKDEEELFLLYKKKIMTF
jgi:hypothetical protein